MQAEPSADERAAVDELLGAPEGAWDGGLERSAFDHRVARGGDEARDDRHLLLPALHALQGAVGWISPGGMNYACERLSVPPAEAYGVATFYAMFSVEQRPPTVVHVCDDLACRRAGAGEVVDRLTAGGSTVVPSPCLGLCERAPAVLIQRASDQGDSALAPVTGEVLGVAPPASSSSSRRSGPSGWPWIGPA